jgi:hypothetical protein
MKYSQRQIKPYVNIKNTSDENLVKLKPTQIADGDERTLDNQTLLSIGEKINFDVVKMSTVGAPENKEEFLNFVGDISEIGINFDDMPLKRKE